MNKLQNSSHINYGKMVDDALMGVIKKLLKNLESEPLKGDHHFFVTFNTNAKGVLLPKKLKNLYPQEMTIVLQHEYENVYVSDDVFSVDLIFGATKENLVIPFKSIKAFVDPSSEFAIQFNANDSEPEDEPEDRGHEISKASNVILLDKFRK